MKEETKQTTQNNIMDEEVLRKRLYALSADEISKHFTKCHCLLRRRKFGKGNNAQTRYSATLQIKKDIYEIYDGIVYTCQYEFLEAENPSIAYPGLPNEICRGVVTNQYNLSFPNALVDFTVNNSSLTPVLKTPSELIGLGNGAGNQIVLTEILTKNNSILHKKGFKWVEDIQINSDGDVITTYSSTDDSGQKQSVVEDKVLTWIESVKINKENYQFTITDNHGQVKEIGSVKVDETLSVAFNIEPNDSFSVEGEGSIQAGNLISQNILFLNKKYPKGLSFNSEESDERAWMKGKIVTIGPVNEENLEQRKNFYAFNYDTFEWYYLGNLGGLGALKYQQVAEKDDKNEAIKNAMSQLAVGGICFVTSQRPNAEATTLDFVLEEDLNVE